MWLDFNNSFIFAPADKLWKRQKQTLPPHHFCILSLSAKVKELLKSDHNCHRYCLNKSGLVLSGTRCGYHVLRVLSYFIIIIIIRKAEKYVDFMAAYIFQPIAVENLGPINASALDFIRNLGQKKSATFLAMTERLSFYSSTSLWRSNVLTLCFCTTHSASIARTNSHSSYVFNFRF